MKRHPNYHNVIITDYPVFLFEGNTYRTTTSHSTFKQFIEKYPYKLVFIYPTLDGNLEWVLDDKVCIRAKIFNYSEIHSIDDLRKLLCVSEEHIKNNYKYLLIA